jgi:hypothetical protein
MSRKATIGMGAIWAFIHATDVSVERNKTRAVIDPCRALCTANDEEGCAVSRTVSGQCQGLFRDQSGNIAHSEDPKPEWTRISAEDARSILSTQTESCSDICAKLEDCPASYCKQNNHCHGLFWSDLNKREACFYTDEKPCQTKLPVLCDYENQDSTTAIPTTTASSDQYSASSVGESIIVVPSSEETYLVHDQSMVDGSGERDSERIPEAPELALIPEVDDVTTHPVLPVSDSDTRSASLEVPPTQTPLRANQNETQASKSFETLRFSMVTSVFIFAYIIV